MGDDGGDRRWRLNRRQVLAASGLSTVAGCVALDVDDADVAIGDVGFNNGLKLGEVTAHSADVWTRLSRTEVSQPSNRERWYPATWGTVRLEVRPQDDPEAVQSFERRATPARDGTVQVRLSDLDPATEYRIALASTRNEEIGVEYPGRFRTAPGRDTAIPLRFAVVSCQAWRFRDAGGQGFETYRTLSQLSPDFFVHTGDMVYYDQGRLRGRTKQRARTHWHRTYSLAYLKRFHATTPSYFLKDDHDIIDNDSWPGQRYGDLTFEEGVAIFDEQNPTGDRPYKTIRWGADLQIWLLEMREFRSPNPIPDGPEKTILGDEQIAWLERSLSESDAPFKVVIAPSIFVGPDRRGKNDNYANPGFRTEGRRLRRFLAAQDAVVLGGDRHWQYASVDADTGLWEFGCGALAKGREGGWRGRPAPAHRFLAVKPGFLWVRVDREDDAPVLSVEHRDRFGGVRNRETFEAEPLAHRG